MGLPRSAYVLTGGVIFTFVLISTINCLNGVPGTYSIPLKKINRTHYNKTRNGTEFQTDFYAEIGIGTPPQRLRVVFDTGYADMWVRSCAMCTGIWCYNHSISKTYVKNGTQVNTTDDSSVKGILSQDIVEFGRNISIKNLTFAEVSRPKPRLVDGVVGLGFRSLSRFMTPVFITMHRTGLLANNIFAFNYNKTNINASEITLGGWNHEIVTRVGRVYWVPLTDRKHWKFEMEGLVVGNLTIHARAAVAETGSSGILGPKADILKIAKYFGGFFWYQQNMISVPKTNFTKIGSITFKIHGNNFIINITEIILQESKDWCLLALGTRDNMSHWVLGDRFLSNYYTIFDMERSHIAFIPTTGRVTPFTPHHLPEPAAVYLTMFVIPLVVLILAALCYIVKKNYNNLPGSRFSRIG